MAIIKVRNPAIDLDAAEIPNLDASKITTGSLSVARLADGSITNAKLNNDAKVVKSASAPSSPSEGDLWYDTGNEVLKIYSNTDGTFVKIVRVIPTLDSISGNIFNATAGNLTLTGTGFLNSNLIVSFTPSGGSASTVTVTPTSDTSATVAIPSAIYGQSTSTVIGIKVTNTDLKSSSTVNKTVVALPSGGTISNSGSYRIHTFNSSGTFVNTIADLSVEYLVVAGGGGGGGRHGGGGGAGGYRSSVVGENSGRGSTAESTQTLSTGNYTVTVGAGGVAGAGNTGDVSVGKQGGNSVFNGITSLGGGGGANDSDTTAFMNGGSGGGGTYDVNGGSGTSGQGYDGGGGTSNSYGSGGGGAGQQGINATNSGGGNGGNGVSSSITGSAVTRAGGGGGSNHFGGGTGSGGSGGGGDAGGANGTNGTANTGGGGGGAAQGVNGDGTSGGTGGSGVVIVRYQI